MIIKRRDFLKILGGIGGSVALGAWGANQVLSIPEKLLQQVKHGPGIESWVNTTCTLCPGHCGISVRRIDGMPVYLKGNPLHPVNQGGMCPLGHAALEGLFNPDRLQGPVKRIGLPGSGKWQPVSWEEALNDIAQKLRQLRENGKSHQVGFLGYNERGLMKELIERFMKSYGSPNYFRYASDVGDEVPFYLMEGKSQLPAYDFLNAQTIVSFGANFLEEGYAPVYYTKMYARLREAALASRAHIIAIDSRLNMTAANADQWIPIRPGTYGALALGVAFVLIREEMIDQSFLEKSCFGYEDWVDKNGHKHMGFKTLVLGNYYPQKVSEITGVPPETILELARTIGNNQPALIVANQGAIDNTNGVFNQMAIHSLNALLGNFNRAGGVYRLDEVPFSSWPSLSLDRKAQEGVKQPPLSKGNFVAPFAPFSLEQFIHNLKTGQPYPLEVLFLFKGNPLFRSLNSTEFAEVLDKIPMVISFNSFIDETSEFADYILPDHHFLEKWDEHTDGPTIGFSYVGVSQPVVEPFYDTRHSGDVLLQLAKQIGEPMQKNLPYNSYHEIMEKRLEGVYRSGKGAVFSRLAEGAWLEFMQQRGWQIGRYDSFEEFLQLLYRNGGWWNPVRSKKATALKFNTPSKRFEFFSNILFQYVQSEAKGDLHRLEETLNRLGISARGDEAYLAHFEAPPAPSETKPLLLITYQPLPNRDGQGSNLPMMQEMFGYQVRTYWQSWAELNPETAAHYGIQDRQEMWIESELGSLKVVARIHPGIAPGVLCIPFGLGHTSYGRFARGFGVNPMKIMKPLYDRLSGKPALHATRVSISRVV